jgi:hypothetical protein
VIPFSPFRPVRSWPLVDPYLFWRDSAQTLGVLLQSRVGLDLEVW